MRTSDGVAVKVNPAYNERLMGRGGSVPADLAGLLVWARDANSGVPLTFCPPAGVGVGDAMFTENFVAAGGRVYIYGLANAEQVALTALNIRTGAVDRIFDKGVVCRKADFQPEAGRKIDWRTWAVKTFAYGAVLVHEGTVVQVVRSRVTAMDARTGDARWTRPAADGRVFVKTVIADGLVLALSAPPSQGRGVKRALRINAWQLTDGDAAMAR